MKLLEPNDLIDKVIRIRWAGKWAYPNHITSIGTGAHGELVAILALWSNDNKEWTYTAESVNYILNSIKAGLYKVSSR